MTTTTGRAKGNAATVVTRRDRIPCVHPNEIVPIPRQWCDHEVGGEALGSMGE
ncbi:hypothetical protein IOD16_22935 [Saccharothrix sp. 6-C]|uniref:hypothetical protein n=1 Tax=Saccharothrix sp. 6-C TaxID=2781735 RepID=UPI0019178A8C|nr:hypothetical protein [Saccharothrix sp. 6-C]QQQ74075.1 hypothetical protein IOD16_22935 [Saccharothrix sp. 6-C]